MERRYYDRLPLYSNCVLINEQTGKEYEGKLCDISEMGVGIYINTNNCPNLGDYYNIQFIDNYKNYSFIISEIIIIVNILIDSDHIRLGCTFYKQISQECLDYIHILSAKPYLQTNN